MYMNIFIINDRMAVELGMLTHLPSQIYIIILLKFSCYYNFMHKFLLKEITTFPMRSTDANLHFYVAVMTESGSGVPAPLFCGPFNRWLYAYQGFRA